MGNVSGNFAGSSTALTVNPIHRQVVSISEVTTTASVAVPQLNPRGSRSYERTNKIATSHLMILSGSAFNISYSSKLTVALANGHGWLFDQINHLNVRGVQLE
ncbi:hypothetical protein MTR67_045407 [Solanum verrucosum]|uniref:Uncharacterized protein n=1 Tax=Solanum verrucosum TaxID=315347 RepID=A0AAF0ZTQ9_SOLVR|nr:hypothetical protein MTR67_045407 [Solanum verrucosum]